MLYFFEGNRNGENNKGNTFTTTKWAGEEKLRTSEILSKEVMYWIDYIYRYWNYYSGEGSRNIYKQAPAKAMKRNYLMFHIMDPVLAIEDLKEI